MIQLSIIAAVSENNVIGRHGKLPWHLSSDLRRFKKLTMGHAIIMGRKTFGSIGRALPGRLSVVLTRRSNWRLPDVVVAGNFDEALQKVRQFDVDKDEAFVIGGEEIYSLALPLTCRLYLTRVHATLDGDAHFPPVSLQDWSLIAADRIEADDRNDFPHTFQVWQREPPSFATTDGCRSVSVRISPTN